VPIFNFLSFRLPQLPMPSFSIPEFVLKLFHLLKIVLRCLESMQADPRVRRF
jgi:hypothetical protein